jgi:flagellar hook-associated protein FlgK
MKKVKRYNEEGYVTSDDSNSGMKEAYDEGALERANSSAESQAIANEAKGEGMLKSMRDAATAPKAAARPRASAPAVKPSAPAVKPSASAAKEESKAAPAASASKETYRDMSGKIQTKKSAADRDAEMAAKRESLMSGIKSVGSSIGNMFSKAKQNYESTRPVSKQVQKERDQAASRGNLAKGGTASSRADGIASRGKTRGKMC